MELKLHSWYFFGTVRRILQSFTFCMYFVAGEENNEITYNVPVIERISVLDGDYLGL